MDNEEIKLRTYRTLSKRTKKIIIIKEKEREKKPTHSTLAQSGF